MSENQSQTYEIAEYNTVAAMLNQIEARYQGRVYDVTTKQGMEDARFARREIRTTRTGLKRLRKELKEPALRRCQQIDSEAKAITRRLEAIEAPIHDMITEEEGRVEREKQERARQEELRIAQIKERMEAFNVVTPWGAKAADIMARLREVNDTPVDASFAEFQDAAAIVKAQAVTRLSTMHAEAMALEQEQEKLRQLQAESEARMAAERAENERKLAEERAKAEAERQERISAQKKLDEAAAQERERLAAEAKAAREAQEKAEAERKAEAARAAEEAQEAARQKALSDAKCHTFEEALMAVSKYVGMWLSDQIDAEAAMDEIETIITANLGPRS